MLVVYSCSRCDVNIFGTFSICISQGRIGYLFEHVMVCGRKHLEALPVDNGWAALVVLLLGDPHLLEGGKGRQDGSSDPDGVLPLRGSNNLDLDGGGSKGGYLLLRGSTPSGSEDPSCLPCPPSGMMTFLGHQL